MLPRGGIDDETREVRAFVVIISKIADAPMLPKLLNQIPSDQHIGSVTEDGAHDTRKCHKAIAAQDTHMVVPPRKNAKPFKPPLEHAGMHCREVDARRSKCRLDPAYAQRYLGPPIPPPKPRQNKNAFYDYTGQVVHGAKRRKAGPGNLNPQRGPQPLLRYCIPDTLAEG